MICIHPAFAACPAPPPPQIAVEIGVLPVTFDLTRSDAALTRAMLAHGDAGWVRSDRPDVKGMLQDQFLLGHAVRFDARPDPQNGRTCVAIGRIVVTLRVQATIFVARDYNRDEAYFRRIFTHESDRVAADRAVLEDYAPRLQSGLALAFSQPADYTLPPGNASDVEAGEATLQASVGDSLSVLFQPMLDARARDQRQIDVGR